MEKNTSRGCEQSQRIWRAIPDEPALFPVSFDTPITVQLSAKRFHANARRRSEDFALAFFQGRASRAQSLQFSDCHDRHI
jgi:hypothetical protein